MKRVGSVLALLVLVLGIVSYTFVPAVQADPLPDWMDLGVNPSLESMAALTQAEFTNNITQGYTSPPCESYNMTSRPARPGQTQQTVNKCWFKTGMGMFDMGGANTYGVKSGSNITGVIAGRSSTNAFYVTPDPNVLLDVKNNSSSNYTKFHFNPSLTPTTNPNGSVSYAFSAASTLTLTLQSGADMGAGAYHINYSDNAKYATLVANGIMIRINLQTKQILKFGAPAPLGPGHNPFTKVSITNDGKYAVATVTNQNDGNRWMRVYDLEDCQDSEYAYIRDNHANCSYRDLKTFITSSIPSFNYYSMAEFVDNDTLVFYHKSTTTPATYTPYLVRAPYATAGGLSYLAMGDSFASGEGVQSYEVGTDEDENKCHLSTLSYPYLLSVAVATDWFHSVACSGAKSVNITGANGFSTDDTNAYRDNQYEEVPLNNSMSDWLPGYKAQISYLQDTHKANVVTLSAVGNDVGFADKVLRCLEPDTCFESYEDRYEVAKEINNTFYRLVNLYTRVKDSAFPEAKIYVVGYPEIADPAGNCASNVKLNPAELAFANQVAGQLNTVVKQAAENVGVRYVDVSQAFVGHRLCETDSWQVAVNGLTAGGDIAGAFGKESFHPNGRGHAMLKDAIDEETDSFTQAVPSPDPSKTKPVVTDDIPLLVNATKTNRTINESNYDADLTNNVVYRDGTWATVVSTAKSRLKLNSSYNVWINSTPVQLGTFTSDESGSLNISATIPSTVPAGYHTIHIYGQNVDGQNVDVYKSIYLAASEEDVDGDGIPNEEDVCSGVEPAGVDVDEDGIDDACDPEIGEAP